MANNQYGCPLSPSMPDRNGDFVSAYSQVGTSCSARRGLRVAAAIGTLPLPVMHRSIVIRMARRDGRRQLARP
jgi:hypothetical protein